MTNEQTAKEELPKFTMIGGYPILYLTDLDEVLCSACASTEEYEIAARGVNWEDPRIFCECCEERIESAYADESEE